MMRGVLVLAAIALALVGGGCTSGSEQAAPTGQTATGASSAALGPDTVLSNLQHPDSSQSLFSLFNGEQGVPRLVLLVSPT
jgi:hypothetical protein